MLRKFILIALASGTFGGAIGTLATAATQSQASPQAIAAALQRVQDSSAERSLASINSKVSTTNGKLDTLGSKLDTMNTSVNTQGVAIATAIKTESRYQGQDANALYSSLRRICQQAAPSTLDNIVCGEGPSPPAR